jgi:putative endonuclease
MTCECDEGPQRHRSFPNASVGNLTGRLVIPERFCRESWEGARQRDSRQRHAGMTGRGNEVYSDKTYLVYILASKPHGVLYIGFTGEPVSRMYQHKREARDGFTKRYHVKRLVYYELFNDPLLAIQREKQLKKWNRAWKIRLIEKHNPQWIDLCEDGTILPLPKQ